MWKPVVISFFDYTGVMVRPWAEAGYECYCFDKQHEAEPRVEHVGEGWISYEYANLSSIEAFRSVAEGFIGREVAMVFGFPPCTDLASSGAKHWERKRQADPEFQTKAVAMARHVETVACLFDAPYMIENPRGALATLWRKRDHQFDPCEYGGYLPEDDQHPLWPEFIPPRDAYTKLTYIWCGNGFVMPEKRPVEPITITIIKRNGKQTTGSPQWAKLGGKSDRTKNIRSATPRGYAAAVFNANAMETVS